MTARVPAVRHTLGIRFCVLDSDIFPNLYLSTQPWGFGRSGLLFPALGFRSLMP